MTESASAVRQLWQLDVERIIHALRDATAEDQRQAITRLANKWGPEAAKAAEAAWAKPLALPVVMPPPQPQRIERRDLSGLVSRQKAAEEARAKLIRDAVALRDGALAKPEAEKQAPVEPISRAPAPAAASSPPPPPEPPILSPAAPFETAAVFVQRECMNEHGACTIWFWQGQFWRWNGICYGAEPDEVIRGQVYRFLDGARKASGHNQTVRFQPTPRHVNEVLDCLKTGVALGVECAPPMWLDARTPATDWIVFRNGIVNVITGEVRPLSPDMWAHSALGFDWKPDAPCPEWHRFLANVFPNDAESRQFLEEWMGYCMTEETKFQKGAMLVGPKRSGKGTISHILRLMVGDGSYVGLSFNTWAVSENSKECLIGKRVGVFADVRFKPGRSYGMSFDPGGIGHVSSELLLNIIGEDTVTIGRKYKTPWHGQLRLKMMLISNEVPNLNDASGVLPSRFIKLRFPVSFFGREDVDLRRKLEGELSGIAARCVSAYQRLCERGGFVQPSTASNLDREVLMASDPFNAMALECFEPDPESEVVKVRAYAVFKAWCEDNGRNDLRRGTAENRFGLKLRAVPGFEGIDTAPRGHGQPRAWIGMRVRPRGKTD